MNQLYLLTGGNIGDRQKNLEDACRNVTKQVGAVLIKSSIYETAPWGLADQELFLNQVLYIETDLTAAETLRRILNIEKDLGRKRLEKNGPRIIDIDILFYNHEIISSVHLQVPHPQMANRRFVLTPLNEIAPDFVHPVFYKTISQLLKVCPDNLGVKKYVSS